MCPFPGVLEFYNANLESIMQYRDLKTEVFQAFREVGNIIIFCLQVEELLVSDLFVEFDQDVAPIDNQS